MNFFFVTGIFAYLNYLTPKTRLEILELLVNGLKRLEYRGYDSAGVAIDTPDGKDMALVKKNGKVKILEDEIASSKYYFKGSGFLIFMENLKIIYFRER